MLTKGQFVHTPRFCTVRIAEVFSSVAEAAKAGFKEPTHYAWEHNDGYDILGKSLDIYHMTFAAVKL